jgi:hypothetical protein
VLRRLAAAAGAGSAGIALGAGLTPNPDAAIVACALLAGVSGAWSP